MGLGRLALAEVSDRWFDLRYGSDTHSPVGLASLTGTVGDLEHAEPYGPTRSLALRKLLRTLELAPGRVLVDFGSGKGRILMVAAPFGFRAVRGVEFSAGLCEIAQRNIENFRRRSRVNTEFEVIHADAGAYQVRDDEDVFFVANSFDEQIMKHVMRNISRSFEANPRPMWLIYRRALYEECIVRDTPFAKVDTYVFWDSDFAVFEAGPGQARELRASGAPLSV